ncbi:spermatogenesis associated 2-like [Scomber japonicus]|uniref:spermatogenesis associated 2-like n=1 Tax=Scomber japonicus TaxID=13676 RepID=UPI002305B8B0|nr:spermatogenesis associated 2-like [Scomber japonicus]
MSISRQTATHLVSSYDHSLEQQIVRGGSSLACRDEELWKQVEELLMDGDAQEMHCLGLDPLRVMEESLKAQVGLTKATTAVSGGRVKAKGGLQGLGKAFEVLEQAALNLYLGPWREEYKIVKMYSGMFTHHIKPVLSMAHIEEMFGLLGYHPCSTRREQLRLLSPRVSPASLDDFLRLSCAFFLARCECHLLLTALGKHGGEAQWELSVVRERQRGHSLQVALDNTKKTLEVKQPHREPFDGEVDVDLYTDEHINGGKKEVVVNDDGSPRSLAWVTPCGASPPAVKTHSNGVTSSSASTRENICISHLSLNCQLTKTSPLELDTTRSSSASTRQGRRPNEEMRSDKADLQPCSLQVEAMGVCNNEAETNHFCECLQSHDLQVRHCIECNTFHNVTCAWYQSCCEDGHNLLLPEQMQELAGVSPQGASLRARPLSASPPLSNSSTAMSSLALCDDPKSMSPTRHPISYHECCNLNRLNPQLLCFTCRVFHSEPCRDIDTCQTKHSIKELGLCSCGRACSRKPLVLCRYCGNEYCSPCWYRTPVVCTCGQTFDQSSSV